VLIHATGTLHVCIVPLAPKSSPSLISSLFLHTGNKTKRRKRQPTHNKATGQEESVFLQDSHLHDKALYETVEWIALSLGMLTVATLIRRDHIPLS